MNEAETRAEHIDPALAAAGWGVVDGSKILREFPITPGRIEGLGRRGKPVIADYVLVYRNRKRKDNVDTYAYFGEPVYVYSLKDGINDGFLTPFEVKQISTTLDKYVYTPDDKLMRVKPKAASATKRRTSTRSSRSRSAKPTA